jgi:hypothetical protein
MAYFKVLSEQVKSLVMTASQQEFERSSPKRGCGMDEREQTRSENSSFRAYSSANSTHEKYLELRSFREFSS